MIRKPKLLQIAEIGNQILRVKAKPVENIQDLEIQNLIEDMILTVMDVEGVGIAAPQVYESKQIFIMASHPNPRYPKAPEMKPTAIVNPKITKYGKIQEKAWEGCLSIPNLRGFVPRSKKIEAEYTNLEGKKVKAKLSGFLARIFQHEYDHLHGFMFIDRLESTLDLASEKEWKKAINN
jgi:peptide deformylase